MLPVVTTIQHFFIERRLWCAWAQIELHPISDRVLVGKKRLTRDGATGSLMLSAPPWRIALRLYITAITLTLWGSQHHVEIVYPSKDAISQTESLLRFLRFLKHSLVKQILLEEILSDLSVAVWPHRIVVSLSVAGADRQLFKLTCFLYSFYKIR